MIARAIARLRRKAAAPPVLEQVTVPVTAVREAEAVPVREAEPVLSCWEAARLSALAEERALASAGALTWGEILATGLRKAMPDRVGDADLALVLLHVDGFLGAVLESSEDWQDVVLALGDGLRFGAAELASMELALRATEGEGRR